MLFFSSSAPTVEWNESAKPFLVARFVCVLLISMFSPPSYLGFSLSCLQYVTVCDYWHTNVLFCYFLCVSLNVYCSPQIYLTLHSNPTPQLLSGILCIRDCEMKISVVSVCVWVCLWGGWLGERISEAFLVTVRRQPGIPLLSKGLEGDGGDTLFISIVSHPLYINSVIPCDITHI